MLLYNCASLMLCASVLLFCACRASDRTADVQPAHAVKRDLLAAVESSDSFTMKVADGVHLTEDVAEPLTIETIRTAFSPSNVRVVEDDFMKRKANASFTLLNGDRVTAQFIYCTSGIIIFNRDSIRLNQDPFTAHFRSANESQ